MKGNELKPLNHSSVSSSKFNISEIYNSKSKEKLNKTKSNLLLSETKQNISRVNIVDQRRQSTKSNLSPFKKLRQTPLFKINLEISEGISELVTFYPEDHINSIAYNISLKHNLKNEKFLLLKKILQDNFNKYMEESKREGI